MHVSYFAYMFVLY